jgi:isoquinoline 1-oxidoreductase beta subunit
MSALDRRRFLQGTAAVGGGVLFALYLPGCSKAREAPPAGGQPNAWLRIGGDNTLTMIVARTEMGQGVYTALPMLLAEELEVPVASLKLDAAPVGADFGNVLLGGQVTGGSASVRDSWERTRLAGAQVRTMLVAAAATRWNVDPATCKVANATVRNADGDSFTYGELAEAAAKLPVPADVKLKDPSTFTQVGKPLPRLDTPEKVDGSAKFGIDVQLPGMLHAAIAQCPVLGGTLKSFDASAAEGMPGVRKVLKSGNSSLVVVADHWWQAKQALAAVPTEWDAGASGTLDNAKIREKLRTASGSAVRVTNAGDAKAALGARLMGKARRVNAVYEVPLLAHATLEPMNCTADVRADGCDVYAPNQGPPFVQAAAAAAAGLKPEQVRVHTTLIGGGFGRRIEFDYVPAAVEASKAVGTPVKLIWSREEDTTHDAYRPAARNEVSASLDGEGQLFAMQVKLIGPSITARLFGLPEGVADAFAIEAAQNILYSIPNLAVDWVRQELDLTVGYWRSVSHVANCFAVEGVIDELAAAAGQDPYAFRLAHLQKQPRAKAVLEAAATRADWGNAPAGRHHGIALMEGYGSYLAQVAEISAARDGTLQVHRIVCAVDCGHRVNPSIVEAQVESGIIFGLTAALWGDITVNGGAVQETNFHQYRLMRINEAPQIDVILLPSTEAPGGMGEPSTALVAPAVCNAIFAATGKRLRSLPIRV